MADDNWVISTTNWMSQPGVVAGCSQPVSSGLPLSKLYDGRADVPCRVLAASFQLNIDLAAVRSVHGVIFSRTSLSAQATMRFGLGSGLGLFDLFDTGVVPGGVHPRVGQLAACLPEAEDAQYVTVQIADAGNTTGFVNLGELWVGGEDILLTCGVSWGAELGVQFRDDVVRAHDGTPWTFQKRGLRQWKVSFDYLSNNDTNAMIDMVLAQTGAMPVMFMPKQNTGLLDASRKAMVGLFDDGGTFGFARRNMTTKRLFVTEI